MTSEGVAALLSHDSLGMVPVSQRASSWVTLSGDSSICISPLPSFSGGFLFRCFFFKIDFEREEGGK